MHTIDWKTPPPGFDPKDLEPPILEDEALRAVKSLAIDISGSCNVSCRYCQEMATQPRREPMTIDMLEKIWRFLFPQSELKTKNFSIHIGSGEPLLNFPLLKRLKELVDKTTEERKVEILVYLTTNATPADEAMMKWLVDSGFILKVSIDGPPDIHDRWRPFPGGSGTHEHAERLIKYMLEHAPDRVQACTVLAPGTDPAYVFEWLEKLGVKKIEMVPIVWDKEKLQLKAEDIRRYRDFIMDYAKRYLPGAPGGPPPILARFGQYMRRLMGYQLAKVICAGGRDYYGVGPGGELYPCARFIGIEEYKVGDLDSGPRWEAVKAFQQDGGRAYEDREPCKECWGAPLCTGPCFAFSEMFGPDKKPLDYQCDFALATAEAAIFLFNEVREENPEILLSFLAIKDDIF